MSDRFRPYLHFTPPQGWNNDPNGLVYFNGEWHLFYQRYEPSEADGMQWGHAVSKNLLCWEHLPTVLQPDALGQIWSGSSVVDVHNRSGLFDGRPGIVSLFTYWNPADGWQSQGLAYSQDGRVFTKFSGNPVIPQLRHIPGQPEDKEFRDPKVFWHKASSRWIMAVAGGKLRIFSSDNLIDWRFESVSEDIQTECPDLFELPVDGNPDCTRWVLAGSGQWYWLGDFDGRTFVPRSERLPMTYGPDCYAAQTWSDAPDGRRIAIAWLFGGRYQCGPRPGRIQNTFPTPWAGGGMTLPYELTLRSTPEGVRLCQVPVKELEGMRTGTGGELNIAFEGGKLVKLADLKDGVLDIELAFETKGQPDMVLQIPSAHGGEYRLLLCPSERRLVVDRRSSGLTGVESFLDQYEAPLLPGADGVARIRAIIDRASIEVCGNDGLVHFPAIIFPAPSGTLTLAATSGRCRVRTSWTDATRVGPELAVSHPRCEYLVDPLGIQERIPRLSWLIEGKARGVCQHAYQILAATTTGRLNEGDADLWDTGRYVSDQTCQVPYGGKPLRSGQRVWWTVRVWDEHGKVSAFANPAFWEMGLLEPDDWRAWWITADQTVFNFVPVPCAHLRKSFALAFQPVRARLYITALGLYQPYLNGRCVSRDLFRPGWTDYHQRIQYQVYDVTGFLRVGENALGVVLGDGWYCGEFGWYDQTKKSRCLYGREPRALAQLVIEDEDGAAITVVSDKSWRGRQGSILSSDLLMGETCDARRALTGWSEPGYDDRAWREVWARELGTEPSGRDPGPAVQRTDGTRGARVPLEGRPGPAVKSVAELPARSMTSGAGGTQLFDLGQIINGYARLAVNGPAGSTVILRFAERLDADGRIYTDHYRRALCTDQYTLRGGGPEVFEPAFTYRTFRYVEASGLPAGSDLSAVTGIALCSDIPQSGSFSCSSSLLNRIHAACVWTIRNNYLDVPTDCNSRDERLGWLADVRLPWMTAAYTGDIAGFHAKWLTDVLDSRTVEGAYPFYAPRPFDWIDGVDQGEGCAGWADSGVLLPWLMFRTYGDVRVLQRHYDAMCRYVRLLHERNPDGRWRTMTGSVQASDWLSTIDDTAFGQFKEVFATAQLAYTTAVLARIATVLGKEHDATEFESLAARAREAFRRHYQQPDGAITPDVQSSYTLALAYDLLPVAERPEALRRLIADIAGHDWHLTTGLTGTALLPQVLTRFGRPDVFYRLVMQETCPSWGYMLGQGATTLWERWNSWTPQTGFASTGMNSFCHPALASVGAWFYAVVAGIDQDDGSAGFANLVLRPCPGGGLTWARAEYHSMHGRIGSAWTIEGDRFAWDIEVPPNTHATAYVPALRGQRVLESGVAVEQAERVRVADRTDDRLVLQLGAGRYRFEVL